MNIIHLMYNYFNIILIICTVKIISFTTFQPSLKREIRYTKFDVISTNMSVLTINESTIKQYYGKQSIFLQVFVHKMIPEFHVTFSISKCKEHYIDCYNVVSYNISDVCSKLKLLKHFIMSTTGHNNEVKSCPAYGEYHYRNVSIDADKFGSEFSLSTDKYWEYYWKVNVIGYTVDRIKLYITNLEFYFIQFRSRQRQNQQ